MLSLTTITAILFSTTILCTYLCVRLNWVRVPSALIVGFMFNSLGFFMFAIARGNGLQQAIFVGFLQGLIFTVAAVSMGAYFRQSTHKEIAEEKRELDFALGTMSNDLQA
jgi:hypothetical protein